MLTLVNRAEFKTLTETLALAAAAEPARPAVIFCETGREDVIISRGKFLNDIRAQSIALKRLGIGPGDLVVIAHSENLTTISLFWSSMLAGAIPSIFPTLTPKLDPEIYMANMAELASISRVRAIFSSDEFAPRLAGIVPCPVYSQADLEQHSSKAAQASDNFTAHVPDPDEIAFLQHSSGTTGLQKGVALSHRAVLNQVASYSQAIGLVAEDVVVSWLPLYHDMGLIAGFLLPMIQGIPLVLMSPFDWVSRPATLFRAIDRYQGTLCWLPNFAYNHSARRIRQRDTEGLSAASMRLFINCSEPVYDESHHLFLERFAGIGLRPEMLAVSYAMAENTFAVTQTPAGEKPILDIIDRKLLEEEGLARPVEAGHPRAVIKVSNGPPIEGTAVRVEDEHGRTLEQRRVGELLINSNCMLSEYYNRSDLQPFHEGWYKTGDRGYLAKGQVYIVGRSKDLIINAGKNVYPQDIEAVVNGVEGVHAGRAVAFGVHDRREGTELIAVVAEVNEPTLLKDATTRKALEKSIRQEVVRQSETTLSYVKLVGPKWLIKTSSGKIARGANRDKWAAENSL